jgi:hypothetical protein
MEFTLISTRRDQNARYMNINSYVPNNSLPNNLVIMGMVKNSRNLAETLPENIHAEFTAILRT